MKKASIKTAILIPSLAVLIAGIMIMVTVVSALSSNTATHLTNQLIEAKVEEYAYAFQEICGGSYGALAAAAPIISNYGDPAFAQDVTDPRREVTDILSKVLLSNDEIIAIWTCWEPGAFDGKDSQYANTSFYDATGRFVPYVYKNGSSYSIEALVDYEDPVAGEYYLGARNTGKPYITDPYDYQIGGETISICSLAIPVIQNGKVAGVVGADIDLEKFMTLMNFSTILEDGYLFTLSPGGLFASHTNAELHMKSYTSTWMQDYSSDVEAVLANGGRFSVKAYSDVMDANVTFLGAGVEIGDTGRGWLICGVVPEKTVNASSIFLMWAIIAIGVGLIAVAGVTIFLIIGSRLKGLPKLTAAAVAIAEGDIALSGLDTGTEATGNEITLLERAFSEMTEGIRNQADILSRISQGDYTMTVPIRSDKDIMNQAIERMLDSTNKTLGKIGVAAGQVFSGSQQIADSSHALAKGATEQAASIEELSTSISEIAGKTDENAKISKEAALLSNAIKEKAEKGSAQMTHMMQAVNEINEASSQIEKVIKAIDDIAFQTNILALNAAVEAARAGQHGKGFAVVAEEVRNLAAKSAESASDTGAMIENSKEKASFGLVIAAETAESLQEIIDGINRSADITSRIARSTDEQANAISQINASIDQVSQVIQQNSSAAEQSAAAAIEMSGQSESLTHLTSQFKLKPHSTHEREASPLGAIMTAAEHEAL